MTLIQETRQKLRKYASEIRAVDDALDPASGSWADRKRRYATLRRRFDDHEDTLLQHMGRVMASFEAGLFAGGTRADLPRDNLDLERWFRIPKGHERRIHGRCHAGVRIVQEGPTLLLALDAHQQHPGPFTRDDLWPYRHASPPNCQKQVIERRKIMKKARSMKRRPKLLKELEFRYQTAL